MVTTRPRLTLLVCGLLAAGSILLVITQLEFKSDRSELVDPTLSWNRRYLEYKQQFPRWGDVILCLEGDPDNRRQADRK